MARLDIIMYVDSQYDRVAFWQLIVIWGGFD